jgi:inhibitor of KinA sporulation pathway (predicted exonuclease)
MENYTDKIIIIDLEATCCQGNDRKENISEIIEIGICILDTITGNITKNEGILIKPEYSTVSTFCTQLTTITQEMLDKDGITFKEACEILRTEYDAYQYTWASYGDYDYNILEKQCIFRKIDFPVSKNHINVKELLTKKKILKKKVGMDGALKILNIPLEGTHHRGKDDAKNIAKILYHIIKD